jgi:predicted DNA-binding transcriptional regulator YafY
MTSDAPLTLSLVRFSALITALRDGPLKRHDLLDRLGDAYPRTASARPMVDRDVKRLAELGIVIEISHTRPPIYSLRGGAPTFDATDLRSLALIRDTFGDRHPQAVQIRALLGRLTSQLGAADRRAYQRRQARRAPVQPAIDYTPYDELITRLERAIDVRQMLRFRYRSSEGRLTLHKQVEPYEIEFYERHFYLVGYSHNSRQIHDFRIDRIQDDDAFEELQRLPPDMEHARHPITFRYRLAAVLARGEISQRFENQRMVERLPNGDVIIEAEGRSDFFIVQTLLRYRGNAELLEPAWLREKMIAEVRRLAAVYGVSERETQEDRDR